MPNKGQVMTVKIMKSNIYFNSYEVMWDVSNIVSHDGSC